MKIIPLIVASILTTVNGFPTQPLVASPPSDKPSAVSVSTSPLLSDSHGDPLPSNALARLGTVRLRHAGTAWRGAVGCVAFSHDGKSVFTTGEENALRQWDVATGQMIRQLNDRSHPLTVAVPSPDGSLLATGGRSNQVFLWDMVTGKLQRQWNIARRRRMSNVKSLVFSPDSKTLTAFCQDLHVRTWEVASGKELRTQAISDIDVMDRVVILSPTGNTLASIHQKNTADEVQIWDVTTGKKLHQLPQMKDSPFANTPSSLAFSPDGHFLAITSAYVTFFQAAGAIQKRTDGVVYLWDVTTGKLIRRIGSDEAGTGCVAFSPDGKILATGSMGGPIRLWEVATGKELRHCQGYRANVTSLTFSSDGTHLASGASGNDQTLRVWEVATGKEITPALGGHTAPVLSVAFTPDGKSLVSGGRDGRVRLWDVATGHERQTSLRAGDYQAFASLSVDGMMITSIGSVFRVNGGSYIHAVLKAQTDVCLWDAKGRKRHEFPGVNGCAQFSILSPNGKTLFSIHRWKITGFPPHYTSLWDLATGKESNLSSLGTAQCGAFSPDSSILAVGTLGGSVSFWRVSTAKKLDYDHRGHTGPVNNLAFSPNGQLLVSVGTSSVKEGKQPQSTIRFWRQKWDKSWVLDQSHLFSGHEGELYALAVSPDSRSIAVAGDRGTIHVWETASGKERCRFIGHQGQIWCLAFAPDGRRLASGSNDTTILIWDVTGRLERGQLRPDPLSARSLEQLWTDLASTDVGRVNQAIWSLAASPEAAVAFLQKQLTPVPVVKGVEQRVTQLIQQLDDDQFQVRKKAMSELTKLGELAEPVVCRALETSSSAEIKKRLEQFLASLTKKQRSPSSEDYRRIRALEVLEQCGTLEAKRLLESLAQGEPSASLTRDAAASLTRLSRRSTR